MLLPNEPVPRQSPKAMTIPVGLIEIDQQIREDTVDPALRQLAQSLVDDTQLQPVGVRLNPQSSKYLVIWGGRRVRAAEIAGLETIDCIVQEDLSEADIVIRQIVENEHRESLRPMEQARAYGMAATLNNLNGKQLAERINKSESQVSRLLGLLEVSEDLQKSVDAGEVSVVKALKLHRARTAPKKKSPKGPKPVKEKKFKTNVGITVTFKARKPLQDPAIIQALRELLATLESLQAEVPA